MRENVFQRKRSKAIDGKVEVFHGKGVDNKATTITHPTAGRLHKRQDAASRGIGTRLRQRLPQIRGHRTPSALIRPLNLIRTPVGVDRHHRPLVREKDPIPVGPRDVSPRNVHREAELRDNIVEVLPQPRAGPSGNSALVDGKRRVRNHGLLRWLMHDSRALTLRAHSRRRIRGEAIRIQTPAVAFAHFRRVLTAAGIQQADRVRQV